MLPTHISKPLTHLRMILVHKEISAMLGDILYTIVYSLQQKHVWFTTASLVLPVSPVHSDMVCKDVKKDVKRT